MDKVNVSYAENRTLGGWCCNNKITKIPSSTKRHCDYCGNNYVTKNKKNIEISDGLIFLDSKVENYLLKKLYLVVNQITTVCPFCGGEEQLGCIPTQQQVFTVEDYPHD